MEEVSSVNDIPIRLTKERWFHITEGHPKIAGYYYDILETVEEPDEVYEGNEGELLALSEMEKGKYIVVVYKEVNEDDGFIITSFMTTKEESIKRREKIWP